MNQNTLSAEGFESTYALLVRSEEKDRSLFEDVAYLIFILSAVFSIWHMAASAGRIAQGRGDTHDIDGAAHGYAYAAA